MTNKDSLPFRSTLLTMATSNAIGGYECEFLESVQDFKCPLCLHVTREPHLTSCCGQHFCQSCINPILTDNKPCPFCRDQSFTTMLNKDKQRITLALRVYCTMKDRGCSWTGELGKLEDHLDTRNGSCQYVKVFCTNNCGKSLQRRFMLNHLHSVCPRRFTCKYCDYGGTFEEVNRLHSLVCGKYPLPCPNNCDSGMVERSSLGKHLRECPLQLVQCEFSHLGCSEKIRRRDMRNHLQSECSKRDFTCQYCGFMATFEDVHNKHMPVCTMYPLPCPNNCGIGTVERGYVGVHLRECPLQLVQCEFSHLGCSEKIRRKDITSHMKNNTQKHLDMTSATLRWVMKEKEEAMKETVETQQMLRLSKREKKEMLAEKDAEVRKLAQKDKQMQRKLDEKDKQIKQLKTKLLKLENVAARPSPPVEFTVLDFSLYRRTRKWWDQCPYFYTHLIGAKVKIILFMSPQGSERVSIALCLVPGEFDEAIDWPVRCTVTVQILNQVADKNHLKFSRECVLSRPIVQYRHGSCGDIAHHIHCSTLRPPQHDIQYVKEDCLRIRAKVVRK